MFAQNFKRCLKFMAMGSALLWLSSCSEDLAKPKFSPDYYLPLVYGDLTLQNLTEDSSFIQTDPTGYLKIGFKDTVDVLGANDLAQAQNIVQLNTTVDIPQPIIFGTSGANDVLPAKYNYNFLAQVSLSNLKTLALNNAQLEFKIVNNKNFDLNGIEFTIPGLTNNGILFTTGKLNIPQGQTISFPFPLTNAKWDLRGELADTSSMIYCDLSNSNAIQGPSGGLATVSIGFSSVDVKYWMGGSPILQQLLSTIPVTSSNAPLAPSSVYRNIKSGSLSLSDVEVDLNFQSRIGLPLGMKFVLGSFSGVDNNYVEMDTLRVDITQATIVNDEAVLSNNLSTINQSSSNLASVLTNFPSTMRVGAGGGAVFNNPDPLGYFVHDSSDLKLIVETEVPLAVNFNNLVFEDTLKFSLGEQLDNDQVSLDTGSLEFTMRNGFPYGFNFVIDAMNDSLRVIDRVAIINITGASIPPGGDKVIDPATSSFNITLTPELFENLKKTTNLLVRATLNTPLGASPKIYNDYKLGFSTKARLKVTIDTAKE